MRFDHSCKARRNRLSQHVGIKSPDPSVLRDVVTDARRRRGVAIKKGFNLGLALGTGFKQTSAYAIRSAFVSARLSGVI